MGVIHHYRKWLAAVHALEASGHLLKAENCLRDLLQGTAPGPGSSGSSQEVIDIHLSNQRRADRNIGVGTKEGERCALRPKVEVAREKISPFQSIADDFFTEVAAGIHEDASIVVIRVDDRY